MKSNEEQRKSNERATKEQRKSNERAMKSNERATKEQRKSNERATKKKKMRGWLDGVRGKQVHTEQQGNEALC
jgi:hypothetical protein